MKDGLVAGAVASMVSGAPSTLAGDLVSGTRAVGAMVLPREQRTLPLFLAAAPVHLCLSLGWGLVLDAALPRRSTIAWGAVAGLLIAALDLGLLARPFPRVRALRMGPQVADHVVFGATVGGVLEWRRRHFSN